MCNIFSCVVGRGCLLWPVHSLGKILLAFALLNFVLQGQIYLLLQVSLDFLLLHSIPLIKKTSFFVVSSRMSFRSSFRFFQHYWLGHRLGLLWYWMVCLGNEQRSFGHFWMHPKTAFWTLLLTMMATPFLLRVSCLQSQKINQSNHMDHSLV